MNRGKEEGIENEKVSNTRKTLAEHLESCEDEKKQMIDKMDTMNKDIDTRMDSFDNRLTKVETKLDLLLEHFKCVPNDK